jgi:hypothetical protein
VDGTNEAIVALLARKASREVESGLSPNVLYYRYAEAYNSVGSASSEGSSECTLASPPITLRSTGRDSSSITLNWDIGSNPANGTRYYVQISSEASPVFSVCATSDSDPPATISGLDPKTFYWFRVQAENKRGLLTAYSNIITVETGNEILGPRVYNIKFDGLPLFDNDIIRTRPRITADLTDEATLPDVPSSIDKSTVALRFGNNYIISGDEIDSFVFSTPEGVYKLAHILKFPLGAGTYNFTISASDEYGNPGTSDPLSVKVMSGNVQMIGPTLVSPVPFSPMKNSGEATIVYTLSVDAPITIYMYSLEGRVVITRKFSSGSPGGRAGYNGIQWNGITDFGNYAGNGIYVYKIVSGGKLIGTGKMVVYD